MEFSSRFSTEISKSYHQKWPLWPMATTVALPPYEAPGFTPAVTEAGAAPFDFSRRGAEQPKSQPGDSADGGHPAGSRSGGGRTDRSRRSAKGSH